MLSQPTISRSLPDPALDRQALYAAGLEHVRRLSSRFWTDHNVHDPGITTLELLAYALTDLAYRATLPLEDLLASDADNEQNMAAQFPSALRILPNRPLTARDYRKLLIDLPGVKNAWIEPAERVYFADRPAARLRVADPGLPGVRRVEVKGLYDALVEFVDEVTEPAAQGEVLRSVRATLQANRNLCEDFVEVRAVERQEFRLCGELELEPGPEADVSAVHAEVLFRVDRYLAPPVRNYSLREMREALEPDGTPSFTVPEIFDGTLLRHGFIRDDELEQAELREDLRLSDVISIVMDVPGVRAVRDLVIRPAGFDPSVDEDKWVVPVAPRHEASLDRAGSRLVFYKQGMPVTSAPARVDERYRALVAEERAKDTTVRSEDVELPLGEPRDVKSYHSFQNHFPETYGLSEAGLSATAGPRRLALARQLKGYLLFFDQVMADYCAQLEGVRSLFSTDAELERTYFHQVVDSFRDHAEIYDDEGAAQALLEAQDVDDPSVHVDRRNRFLDHLIARFAERFHDYAAAVHAAFGTTPRRLRRHKCAFLAAYPGAEAAPASTAAPDAPDHDYGLGGERGRGYDYTRTGPGQRWDSENVSGLERRLCALLDMGSCRRRNLSDVPEDSFAEVHSDAGEFRFRVRDRESGRVLLSGPFPFATRAEARAAMKQALRAAQDTRSYQRRVTAGGRYEFGVTDATGQVLAHRDEYFDSVEGMEAAIDEVLTYVMTHYGEEGMYLIENILLRSDEEDLLLPICAMPGCTDCPDDDPYSYRIHLVLPAYAGRLQDMDFRRFVEEVARAETPAHILPKICWISREDMARLEDAYRRWIERGPGPAAADDLRRLRDVLFDVKSVYPPATLAGCEAGEGRKFLLGRTVLGSASGGDDQ